MPSRKMSGDRGVESADLATLAGLAKAVQDYYGEAIEPGQDGWWPIQEIAREMGVGKDTARFRVAAMVDSGVLEKKKARVNYNGKSVTMTVYRAAT